MATKKPKREKEKLPLAPMEQIQKAMETAAHFRSKSANSNAELALVRCAPDAVLNLPYISLRCLLQGERPIPLDGGLGSNTGSTLVRQCHEAADNTPDSKWTFTQAERQKSAKLIAEANKSSMDVGLDFVDQRLPKLLVPKPEGIANEDSHVCITPLTSTSVTAMTLEYETGAVAQHNTIALEQDKEEQEKTPLRTIKRAHMLYGGANPINVSRFTSTLQSPIMLPCPSPSKRAQKAHRLYWNGVDLLRTPKFCLAVQDYAKFLRKERYLHENKGMPWLLRHRRMEKLLITVIALCAVDAGKDAYDTLKANAATLPSKDLTSPKLAAWKRGLIDPEKRGNAWVEDTASNLEPIVRSLLPTMSRAAISEVRKHLREALR